MIAQPLLVLALLATEAPSFPSGSNWVAAAEPKSNGLVVNRIQIVSESDTRWNGLPIKDADIRTYAGIVAGMRPVPLTVVLLRPGVSSARRGAVIALLDGAGACRGPGRCLLVKDWTGELKDAPPPPPR